MAIANNQIETNENKNKEKEVKQYIVVQIGSEKYGIDISYVPHVQLKEMSGDAKAIILTGEFTPYTNVILRSGCAY